MNKTGLTRTVVFTPQLILTNGQIDLTNNDLDIQNGGTAALATVTTLIRQAYNNGKWTGIGITSSTAAADPNHPTAVGVIRNKSYSSLDGAAVLINDVIAKYTYDGDANLDGKVDGSDYSLIDSGFLTHAAGWSNGDFNYDGVINGSDYTLIDNAFNMQGAQLTSIAATPDALAAGHVVPEPASLGLLCATGILCSRRRRRCNR